MGSNSFGTLFKITTWGESHGPSIGVVIDGCPAGLEISEEEIYKELALRAPGNLPHTSPRKEPDHPQILSGVFEGKTTGAPLSILIPNRDADPTKYAALKNLLRPGHANYTYLEKYGLFDHRGGGRSSARETACRVAAGAVAKKLLRHFEIFVCAYVKEIGEVSLAESTSYTSALRQEVEMSPVYCPCAATTAQMVQQIEKAQAEGDSVGGVVELITTPLPVGLGDPLFEKLEANLAKAMLSLPATKGFEIGTGFASARMRGSAHNDRFTLDAVGKVSTQTNHAGGTLGGISNGAPLHFRVAFKPPSSIALPQETLNLSLERETLQLPTGSRHDPCVAIRAVPVVEAMTALVLADALLLARTSRL